MKLTTGLQIANLFRIGRVFLIIPVLFFPSLLFAAPSLSIKCGRKSVGQGEEFIVRLTFRSDRQSSGRFSISRNAAFSVVEGGVSQSMSFGYSSGGTASQKFLLSRDFVFRGKRLGTYTIGPGFFIQNGRRFTSRSLSIRVVRSTGQAPIRRRRFRSFFHEDDDDQPLRLRVTTQLSRKNPFVSQEVILYLDVLASSRDSFRIRPIIPPIPGFWVERSKVLIAQDPDEVRDQGETWQKYRIELARLYPASAGEHTIPPIKGALRTSGFFSKQYSFTSPRLTVQARELPVSGKPANFSGVVGSYTMSIQLPEDELVQGEPFQLAVTVSGRGLLQTVTQLEHSVSSNFFRILTPRVVAVEQQGKSHTNSKRFLYTLYPKRSGILPRPVFSLAFFDPGSGAYKTIQTEAGKFEVGKAISGRRSSVPTAGDLKSAPLIYQCHEARTMLPLSRAAYLIMIPFFALVSLINLFLTRRKMALEGDPVRGRILDADRVARRRLGEAGHLLKKEERGDALRLMEKALKGYVTDKMGLAGGAVLYTNLQDKMIALGFPPELVQDFIDCCSGLGALRYGGVEDASRVRMELDLCKNLLRQLQKEWP